MSPRTCAGATRSSTPGWGTQRSRTSVGPAASGSTAWRPSTTTSGRRSRGASKRTSSSAFGSPSPCSPSGTSGRTRPRRGAGSSARSKRPTAFPPTTRAAGLHALGALLFWEGDFERSARALEESLALYRAAGDRRHVAEIANTLGNSTWALGDRKRTRKLREEAIRLAGSSGTRAASRGRCTTSGRSPGTPATGPEPVERSRRAST